MSKTGKKTLARIIKVSSMLFSEKGYVGTSVTNIADKLNLQKASLYHYIKSKEELGAFCVLNAQTDLASLPEGIELQEQITNQRFIVWFLLLHPEYYPKIHKALREYIRTYEVEFINHAGLKPTVNNLQFAHESLGNWHGEIVMKYFNFFNRRKLK